MVTAAPKLEEGTKLLCYDPMNGFTLNEEYEITFISYSGYFVQNNSGKHIKFETISDIKNTFMIEGD